jgi:hypothetical protein
MAAIAPRPKLMISPSTPRGAAGSGAAFVAGMTKRWCYVKIQQADCSLVVFFMLGVTVQRWCASSPPRAATRGPHTFLDADEQTSGAGVY